MTRAQDEMTLTVDGRVVKPNPPTVLIRLIDPVPMGEAKPLSPEEGWRVWSGLIVSDGFADAVADQPQVSK